MIARSLTFAWAGDILVIATGGIVPERGLGKCLHIGLSQDLRLIRLTHTTESGLGGFYDGIKWRIFSL